MEKTYNDVLYKLSNGRWTADCCQNMNIVELDIPAYIDGHPVVSISDFAFQSCMSLKRVQIPETVNEIGFLAFAHCPNLTKFFSKSECLTVGPSGFLKCSSLKSFHTTGTILIKGNAFSGCTELCHVEGCITSLDKWAFNQCNSLRTLHFGKTIKYFSMLGVMYAGIQELWFDGDIPEIQDNPDMEVLQQFLWVGDPDSNVMELVHLGFRVITKQDKTTL